MEWRNSLEIIMEQIKWLNRTGRRSVLTRGEEISGILEGLNKYKLGIWEDRDYARQEFRGAVQRYVLGFFDDAVSRSCLSVEIGLLVRIGEMLTEDEKEELHSQINRKERPISFTFGRIKQKAEKLHIIQEETAELTSKIIRIRNANIHAHNSISAIVNMRNTLPTEKLETLLKSSSAEKRIAKKAVSRLLPADWEEKLPTLRQLSSFDWCANDGILEAMKKEIDEYFVSGTALIEQFTSFMEKHEYRKAISVFRKLVIYVQPDALMRKLAHETLTDSYTILKNIQIL